MRPIIWIGCLGFVLFVPPARADNWTQFRGPNADGLAKESQLPIEWGKDKNIQWQVEVPGVAWYSLQHGEAAAQIASVQDATAMAPLLPDVSLDDTAALIAELDLIISVDTSIVHIAGALARPCWVLLPFAPDWRWLLGRDDSPWYPTLKLFRQPAMRDWESVVAQVAAQLRSLASH